MTHPAIEHELDPAAYDYAMHKSERWNGIEGGYVEHDSDEFLAWYALYLDQGNSTERFDYEGIFNNDVEFAIDTIINEYGEVPSPLVIDWPNTAAGIMTDYHSVDLPDGRRAYFR